jgi:hypothetical protein
VTFDDVDLLALSYFPSQIVECWYRRRISRIFGNFTCNVTWQERHFDALFGPSRIKFNHSEEDKFLTFA